MLARVGRIMEQLGKDLTARLLAGTMGAPLGAFLGFLLGAGPFRSLNNGDPPLLAFALGAAAVSFAACFWLGDSAVRFLLQVLGGGRSRAP